MRKRISKDVRNEALKLYAAEIPIVEIGKRLSIQPSYVSRWAHAAGVGRQKTRRKVVAKRETRRKVVAKRETRRKVVAKRSPLDGSLRVVAELITSPGLNNAQRVKMIAACLNER